MQESHDMLLPPQDSDQDQPTVGTGSSIAGLVCGIASIALLVIPLLGIIFGVGGIIFARTTLDTLGKLQIRSGTVRSLALVGLVMGIIGTIIGVGYIVRIVVGAVTTPQ